MVRTGISREEYQKHQEIKIDQDFMQQTNQRLQNLGFSIDHINNAINDLYSKLTTHQVNTEIEMTKIMDSCVKSLKDFRKIMDEFDKEVKHLSKMSDNYQQAEKNNLSLLHGLYNENTNFKQEIEVIKVKHENFRKEIFDLINRQSIEFNAKLKSVKEDIVSTPTGIPEMKRYFEQKIEISELNGQNAILRSSNNERQIMLIEKKIENLYQQLKSIDLTTRES
jgi:Sec-independent protein translocase protein TatA